MGANVGAYIWCTCLRIEVYIYCGAEASIFLLRTYAFTSPLGLTDPVDGSCILLKCPFIPHCLNQHYSVEENPSSGEGYLWVPV